MESLEEHLARQAYYLTYENEPTPTIVFHIREDALKLTQSKKMEDGIIAKVRQRFGDRPFEKSLDKNWGFEGTSVNRGTKDGLLRIAFAIPPYWIYGDQPCDKCEGTGKDDFFEERACSRCYGTKRARVDPEVSINYSVESMSLLLWYLYYVLFDEKKLLESQDLIIDLLTHIKGSSPIGGEMSDWFFRACISLKEKHADKKGWRETDFPKTLAAMKAVHKHIMPTGSEPWCRAEIGNIGFYLEVPSNACYVAADHHGMSHLLEQGFSCHNVDSTCQQLSLFVGLIVLYHEVLEETLS